MRIPKARLTITGVDGEPTILEGTIELKSSELLPELLPELPSERVGTLKLTKAGRRYFKKLSKILIPTPDEDWPVGLQQ